MCLLGLVCATDFLSGVTGIISTITNLQLSLIREPVLALEHNVQSEQHFHGTEL